MKCVCGFVPDEIWTAICNWTPLIGAGIADVAGEDPPMALFMILFAAAFFGAVVAGFVLILILALVLIATVGAGIAGLSLYSALRARSLRRGFRTLCLGVGAACGVPLALLLSLVINVLFHLELPTLAWLGVAFSGACGGALLGWLAFRASQYLLRILNRRIASARAAP